LKYAKSKAFKIDFNIKNKNSIDKNFWQCYIVNRDDDEERVTFDHLFSERYGRCEHINKKKAKTA